VQAVALVLFGGSILSAWGATGDLRIDAAAFLRVKSLGAPVTVLLLVIQVNSISRVFKAVFLHLFVILRLFFFLEEEARLQGFLPLSSLKAYE
jgi:hypothetical protein